MSDFYVTVEPTVTNTVTVNEVTNEINVTETSNIVQVQSTGVQGANGQGVPTGGTAGQVLEKIDSTDYNTQWVDPTSAGDSFESVSKNLKAYSYAIAYSGGSVSTITYTVPSVGTIVKTFTYSVGKLSTIVLSGSTPSGITLTKTLTYTGNDLTGIAYS